MTLKKLLSSCTKCSLLEHSRCVSAERSVSSMFVRSICLLAVCSEKYLFGQVFWRAYGTNTVLLLPLHHHPQRQEKVVRTAEAEYLSLSYIILFPCALTYNMEYRFLPLWSNLFLNVFVVQQISGQKGKLHLRKQFLLQAGDAPLANGASFRTALFSDGKMFLKHQFKTLLNH